MKKVIKTTIKKAQGGQNLNKTKETFKKLIKEGNTRVRRGKNEATTGDVHADNETTSLQRFGSRLSDAAARIYNPKGFEKKKAPNKVLSALSKKNGGKINKKK